MYTITKKLTTTFEDAEQKVREALKQEGFGILTEIDVQKTLKQKLNVTYERYKILGACNPSFAYKALMAEKEIGALLPCNVLIYEEDDIVYISVMKPTVALTLSSNAEIADIAKTVEKKLTKVLKVLV